FVGRQVLRRLKDCKATVRAVVRDGKQNKLDAATALERVIISRNLFAEESSWWADACRDVDTIIHVAWYVDPSSYLRSPKNIDCLIGTLNLAKGAVQAGVRRFVGIGTCFEYDLTEGRLSVQTPLRPLTPYAGAKAAAFMALSQLLPSQGAEFAWCRL